MRDPKQQARRIPHGFMDLPDGRLRVVLYHETAGEVRCDPAPTYGSALLEAEKHIAANWPGRSL